MVSSLETETDTTQVSVSVSKLKVSLTSGGGGGPVNLVLSFKAHCWAVTYVVVAVVGEVLVIVSTATDYTIKMSKSYS